MNYVSLHNYFNTCRFLLIITTCQNPHNKIKTSSFCGASSGIAASIQAKKMLLIEQENRIGGIAREFYQRIHQYYDNPENWKWQKKSAYRSDGQTINKKNESCMWTFETSTPLKVFQKMIKENEVEIVYNERLNRTYGVKKEGVKIISITTKPFKLLGQNCS